MNKFHQLTRLSSTFYERDVLDVAPDLIGKIIMRKDESGIVSGFRITETEAYRGDGDLACHASKGRTPRTEVMFHRGGLLYVYLIYGIHWMLNVVTGVIDEPQAVLIRGVESCYGPGKLTRFLKIDKSFYGEDLSNSERIWIASDNKRFKIEIGKRIGIDYAGVWKDKEWRFFISGISKK